MKNIIYILLMLTTARGLAAEQCSTSTATETKIITTEVPEPLKGKLIVIIDRATGEVLHQMSVEEYKVVPRRQERLVVKEKISCVEKGLANRVSLLAGYGAQGGLDDTRDHGPGQVRVESQVGFVGGAQYQRLLNKNLSLGVQIQSSETALGIIGLDF